jgi:hypothetical protein
MKPGRLMRNPGEHRTAIAIISPADYLSAKWTTYPT